MTNKPMLSVELRALLERVATEADHMLGFTYASNYDECRKAVDELRALLDKPAAQHQGEPVAWVIGTADGNGADYYPGKGLDTLEIGAKLYAEQPAPVAVVMPERLKDDAGYSLEAALWYNLALDEVARLNGVNP